MKKTIFAVLWLIFVNSISNAQVSGNQIYGGQPQPTPYRTAASYLTATEANSSDSLQVYYLESSVLLNLKADSYSAVFGVASDGKTATESEKKVDAALDQLTAALTGIGIANNDIYVDFITQNPIYEFDAAKNTAKENLIGYQTKKNITIRYKTDSTLRQITNAANAAGIYDLIKVDYQVGDQQNIKLRLMEEAVKAVKRKEEMGALLGIKLKPVAVIQENFQVYTPNELYQRYQAYETGDTGGFKKVVEKRKPTTSFYQALNPSDFDISINPLSIEPMVQCTFYLRVKYMPPATILRSEIMPQPGPSPKGT